MAHNIIRTDPDAPQFEIDAVTRAIKNNTPTKIKLMQHDHNSEMFSFVLPRYIEGHDMLECNKVEVHYINIDSGKKGQHEDVSEVKDLAVFPDDETKITCSWTIEEYATQYAGTLNFLIRFSCVQDDGKVDYAWSTDIFKGIHISTGIYNAEAVVEPYSDILQQWKADLFGASAEGVTNINEAKEAAMAEIEAKGEKVKDSLPDDYVALSEAVDDRANALKGAVSGAAIHLDDVSPVQCKPTVKVSGVEDLTVVTLVQNVKNLSKPPEDYSTADNTGKLTLTFSNNLLTLNGSSTNNVSVNNKGGGCILPPGTYTFSNQYVSGECINTVSSGDKAFYFNVRKKAGLTLASFACYGKAAMMSTKSATFTLTETTEIVYYFVGSGEYENYKSRIMINVGSVAEVYEDYTETRYSVNADGTVENVALYHPYTSLLPDTSGAVVSCEYNKDTNKVMEKVINAIISLGGNV